jgi:hypothetical protein
MSRSPRVGRLGVEFGLGLFVSMAYPPIGRQEEQGWTR